MVYDTKTLIKKVYELRRDTLKMCIDAGTGHVTSSFSCAEILTALYPGKIMRYDSKKPDWENRDRFILSKGQASPILYVTLADCGFFDKQWLSTFARENGRFGVHLQNDIPGVEFSTGSLGHGLGYGNGVALAGKMNRKDYLTFVMLGDAELYEGSNWESAMFSSHHKLNNLIAIVDRNWMGVTDFTEREQGCKLEPLEDKFSSFGWYTRRIDGHDFNEIYKSLSDIRQFTRNQPMVIIADTIKGKGIKDWENVPLTHGIAPKGEEAEKLMKQLEEDYRDKYESER